MGDDGFDEPRLAAILDALLVTFESPHIFESDGGVITARSTLRFRSRAAIESSLAAAGFVVDDVRDAPDRPGRELVFVARRPSLEVDRAS